LSVAGNPQLVLPGGHRRHAERAIGPRDRGIGGLGTAGRKDEVDSPDGRPRVALSDRPGQRDAQRRRAVLDQQEESLLRPEGGIRIVAQQRDVTAQGDFIIAPRLAHQRLDLDKQWIPDLIFRAGRPHGVFQGGPVDRLLREFCHVQPQTIRGGVRRAGIQLDRSSLAGTEHARRLLGGGGQQLQAWPERGVAGPAHQDRACGSHPQQTDGDVRIALVGEFDGELESAPEPHSAGRDQVGHETTRLADQDLESALARGDRAVGPDDLQSCQSCRSAPQIERGGQQTRVREVDRLGIQGAAAAIDHADRRVGREQCAPQRHGDLPQIAPAFGRHPRDAEIPQHGRDRERLGHGNLRAVDQHIIRASLGGRPRDRLVRRAGPHGPLVEILTRGRVPVLDVQLVSHAGRPRQLDLQTGTRRDIQLV